jgi:hypothetical protein
MAGLDPVTVLSVKGGVSVPGDIRPDDGICEDCEFSCDGDESDLSWFAGSLQALIEGFEWGIASDGADGGHVEGRSHAGASTADMGGRSGSAALLGMRCKSGEACDLMAVEGA